MMSSSKLWRPAGGITKVLDANVTNNVVTFSDNLPTLAIPVKAGKIYRGRCILIYSTDAVTTGMGVSFSGAAATFFLASVATFGGGSAGFSHCYEGSMSALDTTVVNGAVAAIDTKYQSITDITYQPSADGVLTPRFRSEVAASVVTVYAGSYFNLEFIK